jgi:transcriptional regulator with XRE-family HTH domain
MSGQNNQKTSQKRRPNPTKLGKIFRALRNERDMNMDDMAADLGISKSYLSQVEIGKTDPSLELLMKYAKVYRLGRNAIFHLFATAFEVSKHITIELNNSLFLDNETLSRLLAIVKFEHLHKALIKSDAINLQFEIKNTINKMWNILTKE